MARPKKEIPELSPEAKRLQIVANEFGDSVNAFSKLFKESQSSIYRMLSGKQAITFSVATVVCGRLGYSVQWFVTGVGKPKVKDEKSGKLITDLYQIKLELQLTNARIDALQMRLKYYEEKK